MQPVPSHCPARTCSRSRADLAWNGMLGYLIGQTRNRRWTACGFLSAGRRLFAKCGVGIRKNNLPCHVPDAMKLQPRPSQVDTDYTKFGDISTVRKSDGRRLQ